MNEIVLWYNHLISALLWHPTSVNSFGSGSLSFTPSVPVVCHHVCESIEHVDSLEKAQGKGGDVPWQFLWCWFVMSTTKQRQKEIGLSTDMSELSDTHFNSEDVDIFGNQGQDFLRCSFLTSISPPHIYGENFADQNNGQKLAAWLPGSFFGGRGNNSVCKMPTGFNLMHYRLTSSIKKESYANPPSSLLSHANMASMNLPCLQFKSTVISSMGISQIFHPQSYKTRKTVICF